MSYYLFFSLITLTICSTATFIFSFANSNILKKLKFHNKKPEFHKKEFWLSLSGVLAAVLR